MAISFDNYDNSIVIDGFEKGIADNPFNGIADMRNINIVSVPGEASVNFSTSRTSQNAIANGSVISADGGTYYLTYTGAANLENNMAINFTAQSGLNVTPTIVTTYWVFNVGGAGVGTFQISSTYSLASPTPVHVTNGTGTFTVYKVGITAANINSTGLTNFAYSTVDDRYYFLDAVGQLWSNTFTTTSGYWTFMGASGTSDTGGSGLVYYQASNAHRWLFVWRLDSIDYIDLGSFNWVWGWKPSDATGNNAAGYLKKSTNFHRAILAPDNKVYYCDGNYIGRFFQSAIATPFDPTNLSTYTFDTTSVLPFNDSAQCLTATANGGFSLLIGGSKNIVYQWDTFETQANIPIFVAENNIIQLVTVNTNTYIFAGNRGRIYITNGAQAQLFKKLPDHISGTVEPYFTWGGATSVKNQLYFSLMATSNSGSAINQYGALWAVDLDTQAIRLTNELSYATYAGYSTAIIPIFTFANGSNPNGTGLFIGWYDGVTSYGIDQTSSNPYTSSQATVDSDLIPIGTFDSPRDFTRVEYKLTRPLVSGESIVINYRLIFNTGSTGYTSMLSDSTTGDFSLAGPVNFKNAQWLQLQAVLNSTNSSPSYVRLKQLRVKGLVGPSLGNSQQLSL